MPAKSKIVSLNLERAMRSASRQTALQNARRERKGVERRLHLLERNRILQYLECFFNSFSGFGVGLFA